MIDYNKILYFFSKPNKYQPKIFGPIVPELLSYDASRQSEELPNILWGSLIRWSPVYGWNGVIGIFETGGFLAIVVESVGVAIGSVDSDVVFRINNNRVALVGTLHIPVVLNLNCNVLTLFESCESQVSWYKFWFAPFNSEFTIDEHFKILLWLWVSLIFIAVLWNHFPNVRLNMYPKEIIFSLFSRSYERHIPRWSHFRAPHGVFIINIIPVVAVTSIIEIHSLSKTLQTPIEV